MLLQSPKSFYEEDFITDGNDLFKDLNSLPGWKVNTYNNYNLNRQTIVFADKEIINDPDKFPIPPIWGKDVVVMEWPNRLELLKEKVEIRTGAKYNIALGNRYIRAKDAIAFHSDNEEFGNTQSIASISLGVSRTFTFRPKNLNSDEKSISLTLKHGSLLFMGEYCQENYTHGMKKEKVPTSELYDKTRINVTFRSWNY